MDVLFCEANNNEAINPRPIARSPDLGSRTSSALHGQPATPPRSLTVMATLQPKSSIISRTSFQALDVEEPEFEEEPEVVELPPVE